MRTMTRCRDCKREIMFANNEDTGKWLPLDPVPSDRGIIVVMGQTCRILGIEEAARYVAAGSRLYVHHNRTCRTGEATKTLQSLSGVKQKRYNLRK